MGKSDYDKKYPLIEEGEYVVVSPLKWTKKEIETHDKRELQDAKHNEICGVGIVISKGKVTYTVYMVKTKKITQVSRPRMRKATTEDLLTI